MGTENGGEEPAREGTGTASASEGTPNFTPDALAPDMPLAGTFVTEVSLDTPDAARPVDALLGATMQPLEGDPEGTDNRRGIDPGEPSLSTPRPAAKG